MTVIDTGVLVDYLFDGPSAHAVESLFDEEGELAAPDVIVFETVAVLRRLMLRGEIEEGFAGAVVEELEDVPLAIFDSMPLRSRAWDLRENLQAADGLFLALAERLDEPLVTGDAGFSRAAAAVSRAEVLLV